MDLMVLKKRIDGFRLGNGQLRNLPAELLLELRQAWEHYTGPAEAFRSELGMKLGTLRKLLVESKKLNHVLASAEAMDLSEGGAPISHANAESADGNTNPLELIFDDGKKVIRFPNVDMLIEFLKRAA